ncbi:sensor histidine kinase [Antarctobacter jejuensis]|uniref:sensor histidine kinase n=1 Tax=Antarctobacter jejuensis TaxID=1439938 RepID=UPI003FD5CAB0
MDRSTTDTTRRGRRPATSVRLRLLVLALAPLTVLMPLLLILGMTRWTSDYDAVLIANVESDLRIAEQYLARIMDTTGDELIGVAESAEFGRVLARDATALGDYLSGKRASLGLDFLYYLPKADAMDAIRWPVIAAGLAGRPETQIDIFAAEDLGALPGKLAARARIPLIETEAAVPTDRTVEDRGMVVHSAAPVHLDGHDGVLVGGILLNRNLQFIDTINALVYLNAVTGGDRQGTATLFLEDVRVSTNVRLFEDVRALGTRVSAVVRQAVLGDGKTWLNRAFVVNDWYISGYLPLTDSFGQRVGMLYVGFLEAPFTAAKRQAVMWMLGAFAAVLVLSVPVFFWMARGIFEPLERITQTMRRVGRGDLSARYGDVGSRDEIGQVAGHLDDLLGQVQDRDARLRAWADDLNQRVEERTAELREANAKLEETYRQLVMNEKLASIGEITAGVAHEINNPVAVIQGNVDVIRETLGDKAEPVRTELDLVDRQVARIDAMVGKLLQFARPGEFHGYEDRVVLAPLIEDCLLLVEHVLSKSAITVETHLGPAPEVQADPGEMQQVIINLIMNAMQAMGHDGKLTLTLSTEDRDGKAGACLRVRDSGPGLPEGMAEAVFDPFFTTKHGEGTGLGLSISQTLVQRAGGLITAGNVEGGGAVFRVWLPAA